MARKGKSISSFQKMLAAPVAGRVIAKIRICGPIIPGGSRSPQFKAVNPDRIVQKINWANSRGVKAIIFEINSPGGSVLPSKEIADAVTASEAHTVAWVRDLAASGGYWIASACDRIVADPMSGIGSIGVISTHLEFSGLMKKHGIGYEGFKSGEFKDMGVPFRKTTEKEKKQIQEHINKIHDKFVESVARNRGLDKKKIAALASGRLYLGEEAKKLGLVDRLGSRETAIKQCEKLGRFKHIFVAEVEDFKEELFDGLSRMFAMTPFALGRGIGQSILDNIRYDTSFKPPW